MDLKIMASGFWDDAHGDSLLRLTIAGRTWYMAILL